MHISNQELLVARSLADFHDRRSRGESPQAEDYSDPLGRAYGEFLEVLRVEEELQEILEPMPEPALPRDFGPYTLLRELGRGAVGIVYEAVHRDLDRRQAVKVLRAGFDEDGNALERFRREAKALAGVDHPHIVEVYDAGEVEGRAYYAMALVEGPTLAHVIRSQAAGTKMHWKDLCRGLAGIAEALQLLHDSGVIHRDVKPSNIMVAEDGTMMLADFGLARSIASASLTRSGQALGTPLYMSPEQMLGKRDEVDARSDVYGLGATLYEALAGRKVFDAVDVRVLLNKVMNERPRSLRKEVPGVPAKLDAIARKALEKRPEDRYASAAELRDDLTACAEGRSIAGRPVSSARHAARRLRPYALPIAALLLAAVGAFLWMANRPGFVQVKSSPRATIILDGREQGTTPKRLELSPGTHALTLTRDSFNALITDVKVDAAGDHVVHENLTFPPENEAIASTILLNEMYDMHRERPFTRMETRRSGSPEGMALMPRGLVRVEDLDLLYLYLPDDDEVPLDGWLVFRDQDGELLHKEKFELTRIDTITPMPGAVRAAIEPGSVVTWGYGATADDPLVTARFEVRPYDDDLVAALARADTETGLPDSARDLMKGLLLIERDRPMSAYVLGDRTKRQATEDGASILPWALQREALLSLGLEESGWIDLAKDGLRDFPQALRDRLFKD